MPWFNWIIGYVAIGQCFDWVCYKYIIIKQIPTKTLTPLRMNLILSLLWPLCLILAICSLIKDLK